MQIRASALRDHMRRTQRRPSAGWLIGLAIAVATMGTVSLAHLSPAVGAGNGFETLPALTGGVDGPVLASELVGDQLWVGGSFGSARNHAYGQPSHPTRNLAVIDINTGFVRTDRSFDLPHSGSITIDFSHGDTLSGGAVFAIETDDETVWAGGLFESADGQSRTNLAAYDARSGALVDGFAPSINGRVIDLVHADGWLYLAGAFDRYNGTQVAGVVRVDAVTGALDPGFVVEVANGEAVWALERSGSSMFLAGTLGVVSVDVVTGLTIRDYGLGAIAADVAVSMDGSRLAVAHENNVVYVLDVESTARIWTNSSSGPILSVAWHGDTLYVGATYHWDSPQDRRKLVALDAQTGQLDSDNFAPQMNSFWAGRSILVTPQGLVATGDFSKIAVGPDYEGQDGINARRVAIFRPNGAWPHAVPLAFEGDVNCDTTVDDADVQMLLAFASGLGVAGESCPLQAGENISAPTSDIDRDGAAGLRDALILARCSNDLVSDLCPG